MIQFGVSLTESPVRCRSRTTLEANENWNVEKFEHVLNLWIPKNRTGVDNHCERMRKISNIRGRPRQLTRLRSETVTSTMWQDVDINEKSKRRRAESRLSTVSSTSEDVDYLSSLTPSDTLVEMMTSKEVSQAGVVRIPVNRSF